jgi:protein-S-isoprenylcysteine O-methyltransferase Ste14
MPTHLTPYVAIFLVVSVAWQAVEFRQMRRRRPTATKAPDRGSRVLTLAPLASIPIAAVLPWTTPDAAIRPPWLIDLISFTTLSCGITLRLWCFRTLGDYFTFQVMTSSDQPVITSGPYRIVRHPSYVGLTLVLASVVTLMSNWLSIGVVVVTVVVSLASGIKVEERVLHRELGDAYGAYTAARPYRLVPFVW